MSSTSEDLSRSSAWGVARGIGVHSLIYPLEATKIRLQCLEEKSNSFRVAAAVFRQEGIGAFYRGLPHQLLKTSTKQIWCWPMITGIPPFLQRYEIGPLQQQVITGLCIASVDAITSTQLEREKIRAVFKKTSTFDLNALYKDGWQGFAVHWSKRSMNWSAFLTAQKYLRNQAAQSTDGALSLFQQAKIGIQVALFVSLVSAPFDLANTLKQAQNLSPSHLLSRKGLVMLHRGWPLSALSLVIQNIASVTLIEKLEKR